MEVVHDRPLHLVEVGRVGQVGPAVERDEGRMRQPRDEVLAAVERDQPVAPVVQDQRRGTDGGQQARES